MALKLQFWGATETVTGSLHHVISEEGLHFFLDCGLYQGRRQDAEARNRQFPIDPVQVSGVILSHAHLDHSGNLPSLVKNGFRGPVYCTPATADLLPILLKDSAHLMLRDIEYINKRKVSRGQEPLEPLYSLADVEQTIRQIEPVPYHFEKKLDSSLTFRFFDAGHILGSAITRLTWQASNGESRFLVFTGDLGRDHLPILRDPERLDSAHYIITESTYGGRFHDDLSSVEDELSELIRTAINRRSKILIPAFSVGRTQEILYVLNTLLTKGRIPQIPVYLDSPMAIEATAIFSKHLECFDEETMQQLKLNLNPLSPPGVTFTRTVDESKELNGLEGAAVIISASGMCEGGRIVHHIANHAAYRDNVILFVGYQGENTLGRKILDGHKQVNMLGDTFAINCQVKKMLAFSAHADEWEIINWMKAFDAPSIRQIFLVHGEPTAQQALQESLGREGLGPVTIAKHKDIFKLG
ncbi:MAG: MBL fold metallo-hydrolase [Bacteroidetes bacterium]|nr:MBL fold metallo-hydrolase [Bacteroidota bacterium]